MPSVVRVDGFIFAAKEVGGAYLRAVGSILEPQMVVEVSKLKDSESKRERAQAEARHSDDQPSRNSSRAPESTAISPFNFEGKDVRVIADKDGGEPWFVAGDVARALGYVSTANAIAAHCKGVTEMVTPTRGGPQKVKVIREPDVYRLVSRSKLPSAQEFERMVFEDILPSIRKTGRYEAPRHESQPPSDALAIAREQHKVVGILLDEVGTLKGSAGQYRGACRAESRVRRASPAVPKTKPRHRGKVGTGAIRANQPITSASRTRPIRTIRRPHEPRGT